jgi:hypothetical protein
MSWLNGGQGDSPYKQPSDCIRLADPDCIRLADPGCIRMGDPDCIRLADPRVHPHGRSAVHPFGRSRVHPLGRSCTASISPICDIWSECSCVRRNSRYRENLVWFRKVRWGVPGRAGNPRLTRFRGSRRLILTPGQGTRRGTACRARPGSMSFWRNHGEVAFEWVSPQGREPGEGAATETRAGSMGCVRRR